MADLKRIIEILNGRSDYQPPAFLLQWRNIYFRTSIHTTGTCPRYLPLRWTEKEGYYLDTSFTYPTSWLMAAYDTIFDECLLNRHPRESHLIREYRKSVYRPYQQAALQQVIDKIRAVISADNKYTLIVDNEDDNKYIWGPNFDGKSLVEYVFCNIKTICEDPNGKFVVIPKEPGYKTSTSKVEPTIKFIPSRTILYYTPTEIIFREDAYAWYVNEKAYLRFEKNDKNEYVQADGRRGYYAHLLGYAPARDAGGVWNTHGYYDSYLKPAQAYCDDFVAAHSAVQLVNKEAAHPFIIAASRDCPECEGHSTFQYCNKCHCATDSGCTCNDSANYKLQSCSACKGSGQQSYNPAEWLIVPPNEMGNDLIKIVNPDITINEFLAKYAADLYNGILKSLHQQHIDEAQSGTAKEIDREGEYLFYQTVSNGIFGLIESLLRDILAIRNTSKANGNVNPEVPRYVLVKPTQFDLKTENDLLEEFKVATESKIPDYIRAKQAESFVDKLYGGDDAMVKRATIINEMDPYSVMSPTDKDVMISAGIADADTMRFSNILPNILQQLIRVKGKKWFLESEYAEIEKEVRAIFDKLPKPVKPVETTQQKVIV